MSEIDMNKAEAIQHGVEKAYDILRFRGYVCRSNFSCCGTCACSELGRWFDEQYAKEEDRKYVFWHSQGHERLIGDEDPTLNLHWAGYGEEIAETIRSQGLSITWDGTEFRTINVSITDEQLSRYQPYSEESR